MPSVVNTLVAVILDAVAVLVLAIGLGVAIVLPLLAPVALIGTQIAAGVLFLIAFIFFLV